MWVNNWSEVFNTEPKIDCSFGKPMVVHCLYRKLRIASFQDESGEDQRCYIDWNNMIFRIDGNIVNQVWDNKRLEDGTECAGLETKELWRKYYDRELRRITKDIPHPSIAYRWRDEYFIDSRKPWWSSDRSTSVWWEIQGIQHHIWWNACWMFKIDEDNNILTIDGHTVIAVWETKQIEWEDYTEVWFNNTKAFCDKDKQQLPIKPWIEKNDPSVMEVKDVNGKYIAIKSMYWRDKYKGKLKSVSISNWENSYRLWARFRFPESGRPKFLESLTYEGKTYILIQYGWRGDNPDILVLNEKLEEVLEYPIWNIDINRVESIVKEKLSELIPEVA